MQEAFDLMKPINGSVHLDSVKKFVSVLLGVKESQEVRTSEQTLTMAINGKKFNKETNRILSSERVGKDEKIIKNPCKQVKSRGKGPVKKPKTSLALSKVFKSASPKQTPCKEKQKCKEDHSCVDNAKYESSPISEIDEP